MRIASLLLLLAACGGSAGDDDGAASDAGTGGAPDAFVAPLPGDVVGQVVLNNAVMGVATGADDRVFVLTGSSFARLAADGTLDPSIDPELFTGRFEAVAPAPDGKWLVLHADFPSSNLVARVNADYSFDSSFNASGRLTNMGVNGVLATASGSVFVVGRRRDGTDDQVVIKKLDENGAPVVSFGDDGEAVTPPELDLNGTGLVVLPDGRLIARAEDGFTPALVRFSATGTYEAMIRLDALGPRYSRALLVDAQGGVLVLGMSGSAIQIARVSGDLVVDASFGTAGVATLDVTMPPSSEYDESVEARGLALQADGRIVVAANYEYDLGEDGTLEEATVLVARFAANGTLDPSFGSGGTVRVPLAAGAAVSRIAQGDGLTVTSGRIVVGGDALLGSAIHGAVAVLRE